MGVGDDAGLGNRMLLLFNGCEGLNVIFCNERKSQTVSVIPGKTMPHVLIVAFNCYLQYKVIHGCTKI